MDDSSALHPDIAAWLDEARRTSVPARTLGATALRAAQTERVGRRTPGAEVYSVVDRVLPEGPRVRQYRLDQQPRTVVIYVHGGGFVLGSLDSADSACRRLAHAAGVHVVSVDYSLAPEHPAPAAVTDTVRVARAVAEDPGAFGGDAHTRFALAGDSAGGALCVLATAALRAQDIHPAALLLLYPMADLTLSYPSVQQFGQGYGLDADDCAWFIEQWVPNPADRVHAETTPLRVDPTNFPPTLLILAELDPLRDEGHALAAHLDDGGCRVYAREEPGLPHGFLSLDEVAAPAREAAVAAFTDFGRMLDDLPHAKAH